jgi:hypothetical protein
MTTIKHKRPVDSPSELPVSGPLMAYLNDRHGIDGESSTFGLEPVEWTFTRSTFLSYWSYEAVRARAARIARLDIELEKATMATKVVTISVLAGKYQMAPSILTRFVNGERGMNLEHINILGADLDFWIVPSPSNEHYDCIFATVMHFRGRPEFHVSLSEFLKHMLSTVQDYLSWSCREYAAWLGISHSTLSRFLAETSSLSLDIIDRIFKKHGLCLRPPGTEDDVGYCLSHDPLGVGPTYHHDVYLPVSTDSALEFGGIPILDFGMVTVTEKEMIPMDKFAKLSIKVVVVPEGIVTGTVIVGPSVTGTVVTSTAVAGPSVTGTVVMVHEGIWSGGARGVIHRDLKPSKVVAVTDGIETHAAPYRLGRSSAGTVVAIPEGIETGPSVTGISPMVTVPSGYGGHNAAVIWISGHGTVITGTVVVNLPVADVIVTGMDLLDIKLDQAANWLSSLPATPKRRLAA